MELLKDKKLEFKTESLMVNEPFKENEVIQSSNDVIKKLQFKSLQLSKKMKSTNQTINLRNNVKEKTMMVRSMIQKLSNKVDLNLDSKGHSSNDLFGFHSESNNEIEKFQSSKKSNKNYYIKVSEEMDVLLDDAMKTYFIDSIHNLPEYYEEYLIQNLKVIKRMLFFFNQTAYDNKFNDIAERINKEYSFDFSQSYLILDLDETLIHSEMYQEINKDSYHKTISFKFNDKGLEKEEKLGIYIRPHCNEFLSWLSNHFKLILFTAAELKYANLVLEACELNNFFEAVLDREYTIQVKNFYIKDLSVFNLNEKLNCLILDNNIFSFAASLQQGILISSFISDPDDSELLEIKKYLEDNILESKDYMIDINNENYMYHDLMLKLEFDTNVDEE